MAGTIKFVKATIVRKNSITMLPGLDASPLIRDVDCENVKVWGVEYLVPYSVNGILDHYYTRIIDTTVDTPPLDAIRTLRLHDSRENDTYWIAIANNQDATTFSDFCNQCCGAGNDYSQLISGLPLPIIEQTTCAVSPTGSNTYTFRSTPPANPYALNVIFDRLTFNNGTQPAVAVPAGGFANIAAAVTWANSNLGAMGTWSVVNGAIQLVSTTTTSINLNVTLVPVYYCMTLPGTAFTANALVVKDAANVDYSIPIAPLTASAANVGVVADRLKSYLNGGTVSVVAGKVQYFGTQKPVKLTDGTNNAAFTAGAC